MSAIYNVPQEPQRKYSNASRVPNIISRAVIRSETSSAPQIRHVIA